MSVLLIFAGPHSLRHFYFKFERGQKRHRIKGVKSAESDTVPVPCRLNMKRRRAVSRNQRQKDYVFLSGTVEKAKKKRTHQKRVRQSSQKVAARPGLEPRLNEPESLVLPLHQRAVNEILI